MTEEHKLLLETIAEELNGKLTHWYSCNRTNEHYKIVIEYGNQRKERSISGGNSV